MPITIKSEVFHYKDANGVYHTLDTVSDATTAQKVAALEAAGAEIEDDIEAKGATTLASIPADYTTLSNQVTDLNTAFGSVANNKSNENGTITFFADVNYGKLDGEGKLVSASNRIISDVFYTPGANINIKNNYYRVWVAKYDAKRNLISFSYLNNVENLIWFTIDTSDCCFVRIQLTKADNTDISSSELANHNPLEIQYFDEFYQENPVNPFFMQINGNGDFSIYRNMSRFIYVKAGSMLNIKTNGQKVEFFYYNTDKVRIKTDTEFYTHDYSYISDEDEYVRLLVGNTDDSELWVDDNAVQAFLVTPLEYSKILNNYDNTTIIPRYEHGSIDNSGETIARDNRLRVTGLISMQKGDAIHIKHPTTNLLIKFWEPDMTYITDTSWFEEPETDYFFDSDCIIGLLFANKDGSTFISNYMSDVAISRTSSKIVVNNNFLGKNAYLLENVGEKQVSNGLLYTNASAVSTAYDDKLGIIGAVYVAGYRTYGETHANVILTLFPATQPEKTKDVEIYSGVFSQDQNIILLSTGIWRVIYEHDNQYWYKDYDYDNNILGEEHSILFEGSTLSKYSHATYISEHSEFTETEASGENTQLTSSLFKDTDGKYYGCWTVPTGYPILFYSDDNMANLHAISIYPSVSSYEASVVKYNNIYYVISRNYNTWGTLESGTWTVHNRYGDSNRPQLYFINNTIVWVFGISNRNNIEIRTGTNFDNPDRIIRIYSEYGCCYYRLEVINGVSYLIYSNGITQMNGNTEKKERIVMTELGNVI